MSKKKKGEKVAGKAFMNKFLYINNLSIKYLSITFTVLNLLFSLYGVYYVKDKIYVFSVLIILNGIVLAIGYIFMRYYSNRYTLQLRKSMSYYFLLLYQYILFYINGSAIRDADLWNYLKILFLFLSITTLIIFYRIHMVVEYRFNNKKNKISSPLLFIHYLLLLYSITALYLSTLSFEYLKGIYIFAFLILFFIVLLIVVMKNIKKNNSFLFSFLSEPYKSHAKNH